MLKVPLNSNQPKLDNLPYLTQSRVQWCLRHAPKSILRFDLTHVSSAITSAQTFFMGSHYAEIVFADGADPPLGELTGWGCWWLLWVALRTAAAYHQRSCVSSAYRYADDTQLLSVMQLKEVTSSLEGGSWGLCRRCSYTGVRDGVCSWMEIRQNWCGLHLGLSPVTADNRYFHPSLTSRKSR